MAQLRMRIARTEDAFRDLEPAWNEMIADSSFDGPFHSWIWHRIWWKHFGRGDSPYIVTGEDSNGRLQLVAPFSKRKRRVRGLAVSEIRFMSNMNSPFNCIIHRAGVEPNDALSQVLAHLEGNRKDWDTVLLRHIPRGSLNEGALDAESRRLGLSTLVGPGWTSAYVTIERPFAEYLTTQLGKRRRGIAQKVRKTTQMPDYRVNEYREPEQMRLALDQAFAASAASWKKKLGSDMAGSASMRGFYEEISPVLAQRGQIRIWTSALGPTPLALQYNLVAGDRMYLLINDFNEAFPQLSPGTVLLYEVLEQLHQEESVARFQFSGDYYDYKSHWATGIEEHVSLELFHRGLYSRGLRRMKDTLLPALARLQKGLGRRSEAETTPSPQ